MSDLVGSTTLAKPICEDALRLHPYREVSAGYDENCDRRW